MNKKLEEAVKVFHKRSQEEQQCKGGVEEVAEAIKKTDEAWNEVSRLREEVSEAMNLLLDED